MGNSTWKQRKEYQLKNASDRTRSTKARRRLPERTQAFKHCGFRISASRTVRGWISVTLSHITWSCSLWLLEKLAHPLWSALLSVVCNRHFLYSRSPLLSAVVCVLFRGQVSSQSCLPHCELERPLIWCVTPMMLFSSSSCIYPDDFSQHKICPRYIFLSMKKYNVLI